MRLDVWSDIACPWCFLGKRRLEEALASLPEGRKVEVHWRAFELQPDLPLDGAPRAHLERKLGGPERLARAQAHIAKLGEAVGICYAFDKQERISNTRLAHRAIAQAPADKKGALVDAFFRAHFEQGRDLSPPGTVMEIARAAGFEPDLTGDAGLAEVLGDERLASELGIGGVPCFVADMKTAVSGAQDTETMRAFLAEVR